VVWCLRAGWIKRLDGKLGLQVGGEIRLNCLKVGRNRGRERVYCFWDGRGQEGKGKSLEGSNQFREEEKRWFKEPLEGKINFTGDKWG